MIIYILGDTSMNSWSGVRFFCEIMRVFSPVNGNGDCDGNLWRELAKLTPNRQSHKMTLKYTFGDDTKATRYYRWCFQSLFVL